MVFLLCLPAIAFTCALFGIWRAWLKTVVLWEPPLGFLIVVVIKCRDNFLDGESREASFEEGECDFNFLSENRDTSRVSFVTRVVGNPNSSSKGSMSS